MKVCTTKTEVSPSGVLDDDVFEMCKAICRDLGLPISKPLDSIKGLPKVVQLAICTQASLLAVSKSESDMVRLAMLEASMLEIDPGLLLSLHCCARYGTPCIARIDEFARLSMGVRISARIAAIQRVSDYPSTFERDQRILNLVQKMVSHVILRIVNARDCRGALEYLNLYSSLVKGLYRTRLEDAYAFACPWIRGVVEVLNLEVECVEDRRR